MNNGVFKIIVKEAMQRRFNSSSRRSSSFKFLKVFSLPCLTSAGTSHRSPGRNFPHHFQWKIHSPSVVISHNAQAIGDFTLPQRKFNKLINKVNLSNSKIVSLAKLNHQKRTLLSKSYSINFLFKSRVYWLRKWHHIISFRRECWIIVDLCMYRVNH